MAMLNSQALMVLAASRKSNADFERFLPTDLWIVFAMCIAPFGVRLHPNLCTYAVSPAAAATNPSNQETYDVQFVGRCQMVLFFWSQNLNGIIRRRTSATGTKITSNNRQGIRFFACTDKLAYHPAFLLRNPRGRRRSPNPSMSTQAVCTGTRALFMLS